MDAIWLHIAAPCKPQIVAHSSCFRIPPWFCTHKMLHGSVSLTCCRNEAAFVYSIGAFFQQFPRHRQLISVNKRHTGKLLGKN